MIDFTQLKKDEPYAYAVGMVMLQICLNIRRNDGKRKEYLEMCAGIWNLMMSEDIKSLEESVRLQLDRDAQELKEKIMSE